MSVDSAGARRFILVLAAAGVTACGGEASRETVEVPPPAPRDLRDITTTVERAQEMGCLSCHEGIEAIREDGSMMLVQLQAIGNAHGDPGGCVVCHGGNPAATTVAEAHKDAWTNACSRFNCAAARRDPGWRASGPFRALERHPCCVWGGGLGDERSLNRERKVHA